MESGKGLFSPSLLFKKHKKEWLALNVGVRKNGFKLECIRKNGVIKNNELLDDWVWVKFRSSTS